MDDTSKVTQVTPSPTSTSPPISTSSSGSASPKIGSKRVLFDDVSGASKKPYEEVIGTYLHKNLALLN